MNHKFVVIASCTKYSEEVLNLFRIRKAVTNGILFTGSSYFADILWCLYRENTVRYLEKIMWNIKQKSADIREEN